MTFPKQVAAAVAAPTDRTEHGSRNRRFLIRPPPVAENAVSYRQKRRTDRRTDADGTESHGNGTRPGSEKCYLFAGDNNAATATAFAFGSPSFLLLLPRRRQRENTAGPIVTFVTVPRQTHPPKNTPQRAADDNPLRSGESVSLSSNHLYYCKSQERASERPE